MDRDFIQQRKDTSDEIESNGSLHDCECQSLPLTTYDNFFLDPEVNNFLNEETAGLNMSKTHLGSNVVSIHLS